MLGSLVHKQEAVIVQIKMEGGSGDEAAFEKLLRSEFTHWATQC
jgi:hypothetical protein